MNYWNNEREFVQVPILVEEICVMISKYHRIVKFLGNESCVYEHRMTDGK